MLAAAAVVAATPVVGCETSVQPDRFRDLSDRSGEVDPIATVERAARRTRLGVQLADRGADALLVEPGPTMTWLTGVSWGRSERLFALVVLADGSHFWLCPAFEAPKAALRVGDDVVVTWEEHEYAPAPLAAALTERGIGRLVVDPDIRFCAVEGLRSTWEGSVESGAEVILAARGRKDTHEIALLRHACTLTQLALSAAAQLVVPCMTGAEIGTLVEEAQGKLGLTDVWRLALVGPDAAYPHGSDGSRPAAQGDVILVDTGGSLHGYQSDITRTWVVGGDPSVELRKAWTAVRDAQRRAFDAIRPGATGADLDGIARRTLVEAGFGGGYTHLTHRPGHGIGVQGHEGPYLDGGNQRPLVAGNTFSVEPGVYLYGSYGIRIEDIALVTASGGDHFGSWQAGPEAP